ncbi:putative transcription factor C2C2-Dof family [Helianthus annuus]|uniref:Dof zinc finger protein n=1 Tax=Helianthus annuus TaxID=4232 RepID=A0A251RLR6_HELAN|nr:uncharacterized protein LOC110921625 [Helianthus annuus]KAF5753793.1 putative transcription factor C2C2-Dof family [Helianthus annuus]
MHQDQLIYPSNMYTNLPFPKDKRLNCPRCDSDNTKFCYYNNYTLSQPRYFCKDCRRYWTEGGGTLHKSTKPSSTSNKRPADLSVVTSGEKRLKIPFEQPIIPARDVYSMITINFNNTNMLSPTSSSSSPTSPATPLSRYESQKRRDWNTFGKYLRNHRPQEKARGGQPVIAVGVGLSTYDKAYVPTVESIDRTLRNFNSGKDPVLLQFWESTPSNSDDMGCNLMLTDQTFMSAPDKGLEEYRRRCLESRCRFVGLETSVGNWLAGRAAQTGLADHRTMHHVLNHKDQHSVDIGNRGQLVLPVYDGNKLVGIIELVTSIRKESYVDYLEQIQQLLKDEGLKSGYMGKTIKVKYDSYLIRFTLPLLADITDLHREVKKRFPELEHRTFRVEYDDAGGNRLLISSGEDLRACIAESSLKGGRFIKMCVLLHT